ncbi:hypothetical protein BBO99_00000336 [Phytophthora kernoviae]|uniref:Uncharacterized protein n=2 Tax=Phytophthora kernoviae TaxID=325452 RepID=A0A3R7K4F9_9STRA|nr:hypothetical protein G195_000780 [Phytophthora kernoviae 00238/432]KAG2532849.1 hypothetical protein JM16_000094 [Phytophthora kernoviae]KAG2533586.1 hypothetical protein JM18_000096 [Phytophthora kernoviae]RLN11110.1 hypothetical protein BBI17_000125 [Phytophthora kernoviae]RLN86060.1 hypothetical protein BBO99_00000336 [Phytophthora kernoviae]
MNMNEMNETMLTEAQSSPTPSTPQSSKTKTRFSHTSELQLEYLVQWLEQPGNFDLLARPTRDQVAENANTTTKRLKKTDGYKSLAQYMNHKAHTQWTEKMACSRYKSFMATYYRAKRQRPLHLPPLYKRVDTLARGEYVSLTPTRVVLAEMQAPSFQMREMPKLEKAPLKTSEGGYEAHSSSVLNMQTESIPPLSEKAPSKTPSELGVKDSELGAKESSLPTSMTDAMPLNEKVLWLESQRLAVKQQELELKQMKQTQRVEMIVKLAAAGKSAEE